MSVESDTTRYYQQLDRDQALEDAIERERESILNDEDELQEVSAKVLLFFKDILEELACNVYIDKRAAEIGVQISQAGKEEIDRRARERVQSNIEAAQESRGGGYG